MMPTRFRKGYTLAHLLLCAACCACFACSGRGPAGSAAPAGGLRPDSVPAVSVQAPVGSLLTYEERKGEALFAKYCAVCHGTEGKGDGFNAFNLDPRPRDLSDSAYMSALSDDQVLQTISGGGRSVNKSPLMPAYGRTLSHRETAFLIAFLRTLGGKR